MQNLLYAFLLLLVAVSSYAQSPLSNLFSRYAENEGKNSPSPRHASNLEEREEIIVSNYESHSKSTTNLMQVAVAYGYLGKITNAVNLLQDFLQTHPERPSEQALLGEIYLYINRVPEALSLLEKSAAKGETNSFFPLALACVSSGKLDLMHKYLPTLLAHLETPGVRQELVDYSQRTQPVDRELFLKAVDGISDEYILKEYRLLIPRYIQGFWEAGNFKRAVKIQSMTEESNEYAIDILLDGKERRKSVIAIYEGNPALWADRELLLFAVAYAGEGQFDQAVPLYKKVLAAKPNSGRAWRGLGAISAKREDYEAAIGFFKKGWQFQDKQCLKGLALLYAGTENFQEFKSILPSLMAEKDSDVEILNYILHYCTNVEPPEKELFLKLVKDLSDKKILSRADTAREVIAGLRKFGEVERAQALERQMGKTESI